MRVTRVSALAIPAALALGSLASAGPVLAAVCDGATTSLGNGTFEAPVTASTYSLLPAAKSLPWQTTDGLGQIELWGTGFLGVPAFEGNAFAEINANTAGTLFQDVVQHARLDPDLDIGHRARQGDDTMVVLIGDANVADVTGSPAGTTPSADLTDSVDAWGRTATRSWSPQAQTCTRWRSRAVSTGSGDDSIGNFLDAVDFTVTVPAAAPASPAGPGRSASARPDRSACADPDPTSRPTRRRRLRDRQRRMRRRGRDGHPGCRRCARA